VALAFAPQRAAQRQRTYTAGCVDKCAKVQDEDKRRAGRRRLLYDNCARAFAVSIIACSQAYAPRRGASEATRILNIPPRPTLICCQCRHRHHHCLYFYFVLFTIANNCLMIVHHAPPLSTGHPLPALGCQCGLFVLRTKRCLSAVRQRMPRRRRCREAVRTPFARKARHPPRQRPTRYRQVARTPVTGRCHTIVVAHYQIPRRPRDYGRSPAGIYMESIMALSMPTPR